jgi:hypothetical protein
MSGKPFYKSELKSVEAYKNNLGLFKPVDINKDDTDNIPYPHSSCKFVSNLRQINVFFRVLRFHPPIKLTATI